MIPCLDYKKIKTIDSFKKAITEVWDEISLEVVRASWQSFESRLKLVRENQGERIEL